MSNPASVALLFYHFSLSVLGESDGRTDKKVKESIYRNNFRGFLSGLNICHCFSDL